MNKYCVQNGEGKRIDLLELSLRYNNLAPTAPDTLP